MKSYCFYLKQYSLRKYFVYIKGFEDEKEFFYKNLTDNPKGYRREDLFVLINNLIKPKDSDVFKVVLLDEVFAECFHSCEERYYLGSNLHRDDGPARYDIDDEYGEEWNEDYYLNGILIGRDLKLYNAEDIKNYQILK